MADGIGSFSVVDKLDPSFTSTPSRNVDNKAEVNKDEFLQLLVVQLQNQDPLDPMKNEDFAVNLAQFTQVEQLIDINDKLGKQQDKGTDMSSLASYLGHEVALLSDTLDVEGGNGGSIKFNLDKAAANLTLDLLKSDGSIAKSVSLGQHAKGSHMLDLTDLGVSAGKYGFRLSALNPAGFNQDIAARVAGTVSGFVPGPDPKLLVGGKEVALSDVAEVFVRDL